MRILVTGSRNFAERYNNFLKNHPHGFVNNQTIEPLRLDELDKEKLFSRFRQAIKYAKSNGHDSIVFVHGDCGSGVDKLCSDFVEQEARNYHDILVTQEKHPADWNRYGKRAGPVRNSDMVALGGYSYMIAAWDGLKNRWLRNI